MKTGRFKTSRQSEARASERHCAGQTCAHSRYFASFTISCEVNILTPCSQHQESLLSFPPPILPTQVSPTHYRRTLTCGGSISRLLPTGRRCRPHRWPPPCPAALSQGSDRHCGGPNMLLLRRRARTGGGSGSGLLPTGRRRRPRRRAPPGPAALIPAACMSERH
jgi:hypothetical protein